MSTGGVIETGGSGGSPPPPPKLSDYWSGHATWKLTRRLTVGETGWPAGYEAGAHIESIGGVWYLFSRVVTGDPGGCPFGGARLGTQVRKSTDHGATWSPPTDILKADDGTPWECAATDGDVAYDAATSTWHYLFQCLAKSGPWNGCHAQRTGPDPMGPFTQVLANPVMPAGSLWSKICDSPSDDCVSQALGKVADEGTFDIFEHTGGDYYVAFHGYDGVKLGFRGLAKTPDFVTWIAGDPAQGVPADAIVDLADAQPFRETWQGGPIGAGAGSIVFEDGYYYLLVEMADISLGCIEGQNWDQGLFRSSKLTATTWEQLPAKNPILYSSKLGEDNGKPFPCNPAYAKLFKDADTGKTYLHYSRLSADPSEYGIFLLELVPSANLLDNADLWKCAPESWSVFPLGPTNLVVYRYPTLSSDENCYLETNCGAASCQSGQSVYQDVSAAPLAGKKARFGGKFRTATGEDGQLDVVVHELDGAGAILQTHVLPVTAGIDYEASSQEIDVLPGAVTLRYQLYLNTPQTFRADEMFLEPVGP